MSDRYWLRRLLFLVLMGGMLGLIGPAALWAQTAGGLPQLTPISLIFTPPSPVNPTTTSVVVATAQIVNTGSASAGPFKVQFSYCPQGQVSVCADAAYQDFGPPSTVPGLGVGGQVSVSGVLNITGLLGLLRIRVVVNPDHQVAELDPNANEMTALLTIGTGSPSTAVSAIAVDNRKTSGSNAVYIGTMNGIVSAYAFDSCNTQGCTQLIWQFTTPQGAIHAILVDNNRGPSSTHNIYVASDDGTVYALAPEPQTRTNQPSLLWSFQPNSRIADPVLTLALSKQAVAAPQGSATGTPDALLIYAGTQGGSIYALRADGSLRWLFSNAVARGSNMAINALAVDKNNELYAGTANGVIYAIKPNTDLSGRVQAQWDSLDANNQLQFGAINVLTLDDFTNTTYVYAGSDDKNVYSLFGNSGQLNWQFNTDVSRLQPGGAVKALDDDVQTTGELYLGTTSGFVYALPFLANNAGKARSSNDATLCLTARGPINAITVDPAPAPTPGLGALVLAASQDQNLYVLATTASGGNFTGCAAKATLSSTSRQSPNSSPIPSAGALVAAPAMATLTDTQLRAIFFGATSVVKFEVRYESQP